MRPLLLLALLLLAAGCAPRPPLREALPPLTTYLPPASVPEAAAPAAAPVPAAEPAAAPAPVFLYTRTDADLRLAYTDGLADLLNAAATPAQARRLPPADARAWLDVLAGVNPAAAAFVRTRLGPVLAEDALVAYAVGGSNPASCARLSETLFLAVPEKDQDRERPYVGLIARDVCEGSGDLCLRCTNVGGMPAEGARPRVCTPAPCGR